MRTVSDSFNMVSSSYLPVYCCPDSSSDEDSILDDNSSHEQIPQLPVPAPRVHAFDQHNRPSYEGGRSPNGASNGAGFPPRVGGGLGLSPSSRTSAIYQNVSIPSGGTPPGSIPQSAGTPPGCARSELDVLQISRPQCA